METNTAVELPEETFDIPENEKDSLGTEVRAALYRYVYSVAARRQTLLARHAQAHRRLRAARWSIYSCSAPGCKRLQDLGGNVQFIKIHVPRHPGHDPALHVGFLGHQHSVGPGVRLPQGVLVSPVQGPG